MGCWCHTDSFYEEDGKDVLNTTWYKEVSDDTRIWVCERDGNVSFKSAINSSQKCC